MEKRIRWRRTIIDGETVDGDWTLEINGRSAALLSPYTPFAGKWFWTVQIGADGVPRNSGSGIADSGREAREACEAILRLLAFGAYPLFSLAEARAKRDESKKLIAARADPGA